MHCRGLRTPTLMPPCYARVPPKRPKAGGHSSRGGSGSRPRPGRPDCQWHHDAVLLGRPRPLRPRPRAGLAGDSELDAGHARATRLPAFGHFRSMTDRDTALRLRVGVREAAGATNPSRGETGKRRCSVVLAGGLGNAGGNSFIRNKSTAGGPSGMGNAHPHGPGGGTTSARRDSVMSSSAGTSRTTAPPASSLSGFSASRRRPFWNGAQTDALGLQIFP
jgi:hypothetical protein